MRFILIGISILLFATGVHAQQDDVTNIKWPRVVDTENGSMTYYQPQIDSYASNMLEGRCAISYKPDDGDAIFGAFWFEAFLQTDKEARTAVLDRVKVTKLQFPGLKDSTRIEEKSRKIEKTVENMSIVLSLDRLVASLKEADNIQNISDNLENNPPVIYFRTKPTILISVDGEPIWKELTDQNLRYVQNSPFFIAQDLNSNAYYINGGGNWYSTHNPSENWSVATDVSSNVRKFAEANAPKSDNKKPDNLAKPDKAPEPLVVYKPSELLVTAGEPDYKTIEGTSLLFVKNTEDDILMDINTQMHYVLISGRWYKSKTLEDGSWVFENPQDLPADFSRIPEDSEIASVRVSIPNTDEAREALLEQTIPQTAEVVRSEAKLDVTFDGNPKFKHIPNTDVSYSVNSDKSVMKIEGNYYCVDNGIWFISNYAEGPWEVSDHRPSAVDQIPPSEPVYNTKYVYVYNSTPEIVYVGYLPGYTYSYVYQGVVVYGTGYYYPYWYGTVYYPRPVTYGYSVHYNPYIGWGFNTYYSYGWIGWRYHPYYRPYWGPCGYRPGYRHGYYHGYYRGYDYGYQQGVADGYHSGTRNVYRNQNTGVRNATIQQQVSRERDISKPSARPNNMYTDRRGNVYERTKNGNWNELSNGNKREIQSKTAPAKRDEVKREPVPAKRDEIQRSPAKRDTQREVERRNSDSQRKEVPYTRPEQKPDTKRPVETKPKRQPQPPVREKTPQPQPQPRPTQKKVAPPNLNNSYENRQRGQQNYDRSKNVAPQPSRPPAPKAPPVRNENRKRR